MKRKVVVKSKKAVITRKKQTPVDRLNRDLLLSVDSLRKVELGLKLLHSRLATTRNIAVLSSVVGTRMILELLLRVGVEAATAPGD